MFWLSISTSFSELLSLLNRPLSSSLFFVVVIVFVVVFVVVVVAVIVAVEVEAAIRVPSKNKNEIVVVAVEKV
jgi:MFS superfamily sulfate permease-like transporter